MTITTNLATVTTQILEFEHQYFRPPNSVFLLAVSKGQPISAIQEAITAGQFAFGENYLQEALLKIATLNNPNLEWHFIGPIQSNKTKKIAEHFQWAHTIDNEKIAQRLNDQRPAALAPLNICIQVNTSNEASKSGVTPDALWPLVDYCATLPRLRLRGLMCIPAPKNTFNEQRQECQKLHDLFKNISESRFVLDTLSMGMSDDLEAAIAEGATLVRVGAAIFGPRK